MHTPEVGFRFPFVIRGVGEEIRSFESVFPCFFFFFLYLLCFLFACNIKMMMDTFGSSTAATQSASALDDFYASDAPQHPMFSGSASPAASAATDTSLQQSAADNISSPPQQPESRPTVCLGGSPPSASELSGTLDSRKSPAGAKFAVSQVHGVYLALHRSVLSRCAPWPEFFAAAAFSRPSTGAAAVDRIERNIKYFMTNYFCIFFVLSFLCAILNPTLLAVAAVCAALCSYASIKGEVQIGDTTIPKKSFQGAACACSTCLALLLAGSAVVSLLLLCVSLIIIHGSLHKGVSYQIIAQKNDAQQPDLGV